MLNNRVDQTLRNIEREIKETVPSVKMGGYIWYDMTDQHMGAEVTALRLAGRIAHHKVVHTLIRFEDNNDVIRT